MPRPLSFTRAMRLVHKNDFARAFRSGKRARGATVVVVVMANGLAHSRLGLSVGRVIWKSAVKRNRVRRIFREAFRLSYPELPPGLDVIMIPAAPKLEPDLSKTRAELVALVVRAEARLSEPRAPSASRSPSAARSLGATSTPAATGRTRHGPEARPDRAADRSRSPAVRRSPATPESAPGEGPAARPEGVPGASDVDPTSLAADQRSSARLGSGERCRR